MRNTRRPVGASPAGPVAFRDTEAAVCFALADVKFRLAVFLLVELAVDAVVAFLAPAPVLVGLATVVPDDAEDETLPLRSS